MDLCLVNLLVAYASEIQTHLGWIQGSLQCDSAHLSNRNLSLQSCMYIDIFVLDIFCISLTLSHFQLILLHLPIVQKPALLC